MKRLSIIFACIAMMCSCSDKAESIETAYPSEENSNSLTFSAEISPATRVSSDVFESGDKILVTAYESGSVYDSQVEYSYDGAIFSSDDPIIYRSSAQSLSFIAAYPSTVSLAESFTFSVAANQSSGNSYEMSDLLVSVTEATSESCPTLAFKHKLSSLVINITSEGKSVGAMTLNAKAEASIDLTNSMVTAAGSSVEITPLYSADSCYKAILAPQTIAAGSVVASYTVDSVSYEWTNVNDIVLVEGYRYTYDWELSSNEIVLNSTEQGWVDEDESYELSIPTVGDTITLASLSATSIPSGDLWVITDSTAITTDFAGFSAAIDALATSDRKIYVEFPNIDAIPDYAIFGESSASFSQAFDALVYISAPKALSVGSYAFYYCSSMIEANFPVAQTVGDYVFRGCYDLISVNLSAAETLGSYVFYQCYVLSSIDLPVATTIGIYFLYNCYALKSVNLPLVEALGCYTFRGCTVLSSVYLPAVKTLDYYAFYSCNALTSVSLPSAVSIDPRAFYTCLSLSRLDVNDSAYAFEDGILYNATKDTVTLMLPLKAIGDVVLPSSVTTISNYAFGYQDALTSISAPSVTTLGSSAFRYCTSLTTVDLPSVTILDSYAFSGCTALTAIDLPAATKIGSSAFYGCTALTSISAPSVTFVYYYAFGYCTSLTTVDFPAATTIEYFAFASCDALTSMSLATGNAVVLSSVNTSAFSGVTTENISLTLGASNAGYVSGDTLTVGTFSAIFKEIIMPDYMIADVTSVSLGGIVGSSAVITVNANVSYTVSISDTSNFSVSVDTSAGTVTVTSLTRNTSAEDLKATLTISPVDNSEVSSVTVEVIQGQIITTSIGAVLDSGIVYQIAADSSYAMVFSLTEIDGKASDGTLDPTMVSISTTDGYANTMALAALATDFATNFPAAYWCTSFGDGWYLPAVEELYDLLLVIYGAGDGATDGLDTTMTACITAAGGDLFTADGTAYHSSSWYTLDYTKGKMYRFAYETSGIATGVKGILTLSVMNSRHVRAVKKVTP